MNESSSKQMLTFPAQTPEPGAFYRHVDGGLYRFDGLARDSRDASPVYLYTHLWPFEVGAWTRPAAEWATRFTPITAADLAQEMRGGRAQAQVRVQRAKQARRAAAN